MSEGAEEPPSDGRPGSDSPGSDRPGDRPRRLGWREVPSATRLAPDHPLRAEILAAHEAALAAGETSYPDPASGFQVLTADTLSDRGECCGSGCRHCPWEP